MSNNVGDIMKINYFHVLLLYCLKQFKGERSTSAIYHLLKGKKSSQTIQDGKLFKVSHLFGLYPRLEHTITKSIWDQMIKEDLIMQVPEKHYVLTDKAEILLEHVLKDNPIPPHLNGWKYGDVGRLFWRRLSLLVQVVSNFTYNRRDYLPLTKNEVDLHWVKFLLRTLRESKSELNDKLYKEMSTVLSNVNEQEAMIFVWKLTSSKRIGLTYEQIASKLTLDEEYVYLCFWNVIHQIIDKHQEEHGSYPFLHSIIQEEFKDNVLTSSSNRTKSFLMEGKSITEIAAIRNLKVSTIEDHIVEITLHDQQFSPTDFITDEDFKIISATINQLNTHQLKKVREELNNQYTYFEIRLAFALIGRGR
ncbi:helix-turn-helix domain-containing protein [Bacillus weihaiensis]|uniref:helix-turn-helix domain-containing protein n=1 Tax=Bacillus weihaiensis TaxID=1547283 RepID=UPI0023559223|nr:helix-turn-helix domain-containing protein [Bacillus weihaiensis]